MTTAPPTDRLDDLLEARWSCRSFLPDRPVPAEVIESVLAAAQRTPSWSNTQPWKVWVTAEPATNRLRAALAAHIAAGGQPEPDIAFPATYTGAHDQRRRDTGRALYASIGIGRDDPAGRGRQFMRNFELFGAPHVAIITSAAELGTYGAVDCGLYINTFLLAAQARGLGTIAQAAPATYSPLLHRHFDIDDSRTVVSAISFGYPNLDDPVNRFRTTRAPLSETVTVVDR